MLCGSKQAIRAIAVFLVITLFQVYVLADATRPNARDSAPPADMIFGKLSLPESHLILVNGNNASSGITIFSGAQLQTPDGVEATVQLGPAGYLDIAPNSNLTLAFDKTSVDVQVTTGRAWLSTNAGITGTVRSADGKVEHSNPANARSVIGGAAAAAAPGAGVKRAAAGLSKEEKAAFIIIPVVIAAIILITATNGDDDNVSPS